VLDIGLHQHHNFKLNFTLFCVSEIAGKMTAIITLKDDMIRTLKDDMIRRIMSSFLNYEELSARYLDWYR
jgi:hypothetical protein